MQSNIERMRLNICWGCTTTTSLMLNFTFLHCSKGLTGSLGYNAHAQSPAIATTHILIIHHPCGQTYQCVWWSGLKWWTCRKPVNEAVHVAAVFSPVNISKLLHIEAIFYKSNTKGTNFWILVKNIVFYVCMFCLVFQSVLR